MEREKNRGIIVDFFSFIDWDVGPSLSTRVHEGHKRGENTKKKSKCSSEWCSEYVRLFLFVCFGGVVSKVMMSFSASCNIISVMS